MNSALMALLNEAKSISNSVERGYRISRSQGWKLTAAITKVEAEAEGTKAEGLEDMPWFWAYSEDQESYTGPFPTRQAAIDNALERTEAHEIVIGQGEPLDPSCWIDSAASMENDAENNPERCPFNESWSDKWGLTQSDFNDLDETLKSAMRGWVKARNLGGYYSVDMTETVPLTALRSAKGKLEAGK